jgi:hypothetical protein
MWLLKRTKQGLHVFQRVYETLNECLEFIRKTQDCEHYEIVYLERD